MKSTERERFLVLLDGVLDAMREEPNFIEITFHVDPAKQDHFFLRETWADHDEVVQNQLRKSYRASFHAALPEVLEREREIAIWTTLRSDERGCPPRKLKGLSG